MPVTALAVSKFFKNRGDERGGQTYAPVARYSTKSRILVPFIGSFAQFFVKPASQKKYHQM